MRCLGQVLIPQAMGIGTGAGDKENPLLQAAHQPGHPAHTGNHRHAGKWGQVEWCCPGNAVNREFYQCCPVEAILNTVGPQHRTRDR